MTGSDNQNPDRSAEPELIARARDGDADAAGMLLERYQDALYSICLRMVRDHHAASDLTQESMLRIIQGLGSYDGHKASLATWMTRVTMNTCLYWLSAERIRKHATLNTGSTGEPGRAFRPRGEELSTDSGVQRVEGVGGEALERALDSLTPEHRAVLILRDVRGLDYEQIALVLELSTGTVKSRLFRARAALRNSLERAQGRSSSPQSDR